MTQFLQLRYHPEGTAATRAWFLAGDSVERWLEELARLGLADTGTRLFVVAKSSTDSSPAGALAIPERAEKAQAQPVGMACQLIGDRLFIPVEAELFPPMSDAEVRALCYQSIQFFHPALGFRTFSDNDALRVWDLLTPMHEMPSDWNFANPGSPALPMLSGLIVAPPTMRDVFGGPEQEIGSAPIAGLPPALDEPKNKPLQNTGRALRKLFATGVAGAMRLAPQTAAQSTWLNGLEDWANRHLHAVSDQLDRIRNKELHRLLQMLQSDPEAGLRHAISLNSFAHRGVAPPGGRLGARDLNFQLGRLGGQAADFWNIPDDFQEILRRRYREMADRENRLGRHRRAAYIYAELLGDLLSAAKALKQGGYFREAALLYRDQLHNALEAAQCLVEGGLLQEAIEHYIKLERWLEVAELHERLGNKAAAEEAFRKVIAERVAKDDILGAAKLLEERLGQTDEALELLQKAWPDSRQATACATAAFQTMARLGRHQPAAQFLERLAIGASKSSLLALLNTLSEPALNYPHEPLRHRAADLSRTLIGGGLAHTGNDVGRARQLTDALVRLAPQDRLLSRDANRYLAGLRAATVRPAQTPPKRVDVAKPTVLRRIELPRQITWAWLRQESNCFFAAGFTPKRLTVVRGSWDGELQSLSWPMPEIWERPNLVIEPFKEGGKEVAFGVIGHHPLEQKEFPATDLIGLACRAGTPSWFSTLMGHRVAFGDETIWEMYPSPNGEMIACHDKKHSLLKTIEIFPHLVEDAERAEGYAPICLAIVQNTAAIAWGNRMIIVSPEGNLTRIDLPGTAQEIVPTLRHTRPGLAVMLDNGAIMQWIGSPNYFELDRDLPSPRATFVHGGGLALVASKQLVLLDVDGRGVSKVVRQQTEDDRPMGAVPAGHPGQFGVLTGSGEVVVYCWPG